MRWVVFNPKQTIRPQYLKQLYLLYLKTGEIELARMKYNVDHTYFDTHTRFVEFEEISHIMIVNLPNS